MMNIRYIIGVDFGLKDMAHTNVLYTETGTGTSNNRLMRYNVLCTGGYLLLVVLVLIAFYVDPY